MGLGGEKGEMVWGGEKRDGRGGEQRTGEGMVWGGDRNRREEMMFVPGPLGWCGHQWAYLPSSCEQGASLHQLHFHLSGGMEVCVGVGCVGVGCVGVGCVGMGCVGMGCVGMECVGMGCVGVGCVGVGCVGMGCV